jgi:CheY-like chemotaxis protein
MSDPGRSVIILLAEDNDDDFMLTQDALGQARLINELRRVSDGEELLDYLYRRSAYADPASAPRPSLILLDLNMPRMDGREALREIKQDPAMKELPVVVLTTSSSEEDIIRSYDYGVNSFIQKPVSFEGLVDALSVLQRYWFEIVDLPQKRP